MKISKIYNDDRDYEFGCLMLELDIPFWNKLLSLIKEEDIYDDGTNKFGLEEETHITILYGFVDSEKLYKNILNNVIERGKDIKNYYKKHDISSHNLDNLCVNIKNVSVFENPEYTVLKIDVESDWLAKLNRYFKKNYENKNEHPNYNPHITIGYLNKDVDYNIYVKKIKKFLISKNFRYICGDGFYYSGIHNYTYFLK